MTDAGVALLTSKCGSALRQLDLAQCGWGNTVSDLAVYAVGTTAVTRFLLSHLLGTPVGLCRSRGCRSKPKPIC